MKVEELILQANQQMDQFKNSFILQLKYFQEKIFPNYIKAISEAIKITGNQYLDEKSTELITLGEQGWFVDYNMPAKMPFAIVEEIKNHNIEKAEGLVINYFRDNIDLIKDNLCNEFQDRAIVLSKSFNAHQNKNYDLSIPVFLIQADGICQELIGVQLYSKENRAPKTARFVNSLDIISQAYLSPFSTNLPISASERERNNNFKELNRHQILHGEISDYGTEINSLKSISLLNYVAFALNVHR